MYVTFQTLKDKLGAIKNLIGDLSLLSTTAKESVVSAINELFTSVSNGKTVVASAITDKGVQTASDATFAQMANNIREIPSGTLATNYRTGQFNIATGFYSVTKVLDLDTEALNHAADTSFTVFVRAETFDSNTIPIQSIIGNTQLGTLDYYGNGNYITSSAVGNSASHNIVYQPNGLGSGDIARCFVADGSGSLDAGLYMYSSASYKWKAGKYRYFIYW